MKQSQSRRNTTVVFALLFPPLFLLGSYRQDDDNIVKSRISSKVYFHLSQSLPLFLYAGITASKEENTTHHHLPFRCPWYL